MIRKINFQILSTGQIIVPVLVNTVEGVFILDTGASRTCMDSNCAEQFHVFGDDDSQTASGAGTALKTIMSDANMIWIGPWYIPETDVMIFDMSHINNAFKEAGIDAVHGIIGADLLQVANAVIDYNEKCLYLADIQTN